MIQRPLSKSIKERFYINYAWGAFCYLYAAYLTYKFTHYHIMQIIEPRVKPVFITNIEQYLTFFFSVTYLFFKRRELVIRYLFLPLTNLTILIFCLSPFLKVLGGPEWVSQILIKANAEKYVSIYKYVDLSTHVFPLILMLGLTVLEKQTIKKVLTGLSSTTCLTLLLSPLLLLLVWGYIYDLKDLYALNRVNFTELQLNVSFGIILLLGGSLVSRNLDLKIKSLDYLSPALLTFLIMGVIASISIGFKLWGLSYIYLHPKCWALFGCLALTIWPSRNNRYKQMTIRFVLTSFIIGVLVKLGLDRESILPTPHLRDIHISYFWSELYTAMSMVSFTLLLASKRRF